ncbi:MAG: hypothetical protein HOO86_05500 [Bacteroidales bacterium]|nr:hypothetical protein [Bacteroidales bacterium]
MHISKWIVIGLIILFALNACNKPEPTFPAPSIEFDTTNEYVSGDTTLLLGTKIKIRIKAVTKSDVELTHLNITGIRDSVLTSFDTGIYKNTFDYTLSVSKGIALKEEWQFYVRDRQGRKSETLRIVLLKDSASIFGEIHQLNGILLGAQNNAVTGGFYSFETGQVYSPAEATALQPKINLLYFYDLIDTDAHTIASPGANIDASVFGEFSPVNWSSRNTVRFQPKPNLTAVDFEKCSNDSLIVTNTFVYAAGNRKAKNLAPGIVYAFVTDTDRKGLLLVKEIQGTNEGQLLFDIKMED